MLFRQFLSFLRKEQPTFLGRWNLENCSKKINNKIDWANEDHCGTCCIKLKLCKDKLSQNLSLSSTSASTSITPSQSTDLGKFAPKL